MRKWLILLTYCALGFFNGYAQAALSAIPEAAMDYYDQSAAAIDFYVQITFLMYMPLAPFASWLLALSCHRSMLFAWLVSVASAWIKVAAGQVFWLALLGQGLLASITSLVFTAVSALVVQWFPDRHQLLVTVLGELSAISGVGVTFIVSTRISIATNFYIQAGLASFFGLLFLVVGKKDPVQRERFKLRQYFSEIADLCRDCYHLSLVLAVGALTGLSYAFIGIIGEAMENEGIDNSQAGIIGCIITVVGMFGGFAVSGLLHLGVRIVWAQALYLGAVLASLALWAVFTGTLVIDYILAFVVGFFMFGVIPLGLRLTITYNESIKETIPSGIVFLLSQLCGFVFSYPIIYAPLVGLNSLWMILIFFAVFSAVILGLLFRYRTLPVTNNQDQSLQEDILK